MVNGGKGSFLPARTAVAMMREFGAKLSVDLKSVHACKSLDHPILDTTADGAFGRRSQSPHQNMDWRASGRVHALDLCSIELRKLLSTMSAAGLACCQHTVSCSV